ncbi:MAG: ATPase [Rhizobiales bacterium]|jgi:chaperone required for assembly of F1-ATPase|nr:ATPase [Hyphomicrobiales bacterium]
MASQGDGNTIDPMESARRLAGPALQKRFYRQAEARLEDGGYTLRLDGKRANTPGRHPLAVADPRIGEAVAAEWNAQSELIEPATMPVTRLANTAIDGVAERMEEVRGDIVAYAGADLLCYRAGEPEALVARQSEFWDPILAWAEGRFGGRFVLAEGVMHVGQPRNTIAAVGAELGRYDDPFRLAGLHLATTLTGSALIALGLQAGAIGIERAWAAAHVDEDWQISQWGADAEATERRRRRFEDFRAAALAIA